MYAPLFFIFVLVFYNDIVVSAVCNPWQWVNNCHVDF